MTTYSRDQRNAIIHVYKINVRDISTSCNKRAKWIYLQDQPKLDVCSESNT